MSFRTALADGTIRRITGANAASNLASGIFLGALPLAVAARGAGPFLIGLVAASLTGWWLLSLPLGAVVDHYGVGPTLRIAGTVRIAAVGLIGAHALVPAGWAIPVIVIGAAVFGLTDVLVDCATETMPTLLVAEDDWDTAYSLFVTVNRATNMVLGPSIGAGLLAISTGLPFLIAALALAVSWWAYSTYFADPRVGRQTPTEPTGGASEVLFGGLRHVTSDPFLRAVAITLVGVVIAEEAVATVVAPYFRDAHGDHWAQVLGLLRSGAGIAALLASLCAGGLAVRFGRNRVLRVVAGGAALSPLVLAAAPAVGPVLVALVVSAVAEAIWVPLVQAEIGRRTPRHLMARTRAAIMFLTWGALPVAALAAGALAQAVGTRPVLLAAAAVAATSCLLGVWRSLGSEVSGAEKGDS